MVFFIIDEFFDFVDDIVGERFPCSLMIDFDAEWEMERFEDFFLLVKDTISDLYFDRIFGFTFNQIFIIRSCFGLYRIANYHSIIVLKFRDLVRWGKLVDIIHPLAIGYAHHQ